MHHHIKIHTDFTDISFFRLVTYLSCKLLATTLNVSQIYFLILTYIFSELSTFWLENVFCPSRIVTLPLDCKHQRKK